MKNQDLLSFLDSVIHSAFFTQLDETEIAKVLDFTRSMLDVAPSTDLTPNFNELTAFVRFGKIASIKRYRQRTGLALRESKLAIERATDTLGLIPGESSDIGEHFVLDPHQD